MAIRVDAALSLGVPLDLLGLLGMDDGSGLALLVHRGLFDAVLIPGRLIAATASPSEARPSFSRPRYDTRGTQSLGSPGSRAGASGGSEVVAVLSGRGVESSAEGAVHGLGGAETAGPRDLLDRVAGRLEQPAGRLEP